MTAVSKATTTGVLLYSQELEGVNIMHVTEIPFKEGFYGNFTTFFLKAKGITKANKTVKT